MPYLTKRPRSYWCEDTGAYINPTGETVIEQDNDPEPTGLLDASGNELYRVRDKSPIGYRSK